MSNTYSAEGMPQKKKAFLWLWLGLQAFFMLLLGVVFWQLHLLPKQSVTNTCLQPPHEKTKQEVFYQQELQVALTKQYQDLSLKLSQLEHQIKAQGGLGTPQATPSANSDPNLLELLQLSTKLSFYSLCTAVNAKFIGAMRPPESSMGRVPMPDIFGENGPSNIELSNNFPFEVKALCQKTLPPIGLPNFSKISNKIQEVVGDKPVSSKKIH